MDNLFYKVIHNKFLFNLILNKIESVEWIDYDNFRQIHIDNKIKFKDIISLEWMIENKQYQLLKCKLLANEYILINENGIRELFQMGLNEGGSSSASSTSSASEINNNQLLLLKELIELLFEKKLMEISEFDLLQIALGFPNSQLKRDLKIRKTNLYIIKLLVGLPFKLPIYPTTLEWAIANSEPIIVDTLINHSDSITISEDTKNKSISIAFSNYKFKEEMIQFILNNSKLFNTNSFQQISSSSPNIIVSLKKFKSIDGLPITTSSYYDNQDNQNNNNNNIQKLDLYEILSIESIEIQNKLLNLNYLKLPLDLKSSSSNQFNDKVNQILESNENNNKIKEIYKLLSIEFSNKFYSSYLSKFDEPIVCLNTSKEIDQVLYHIFSSFSVNSLQWFLNFIINNNNNSNNSNNNNSNSNNNGNSIDYDDSIKDQIKNIEMTFSQSSINRELNSTFEFIKLYSSLDQFENEYCDKAIIKFILTSNSREEYDKAIGCIDPLADRFKSILPTKWNSILIDLNNWKRSSIQIKDIDSIDWIVDNANNELLIEKCMNLNTTEIFQFETLELIDYASFKFGSCNSNFRFSKFSEQRLLYLPFIKAISECDVDALQFIDNNRIVLKNDLIGPYRNSIETQLSCQSTERMKRLADYLGKSGYKNFKPDCFGFLVETITGIENPKFDLSQVKLDFTFFMDKTIDLLIHSFKNSNFKIIQFILNNCNPIASHSFIDQWDNSYRLHYIYVLDHVDKNYAKFFNSDTCIQDVIGCIKILLSHYNNPTEHCQNSTIVIPNYLNILKKLINYQFKRLIEIKNVSMQQLNYVYKLISQENQIELDHSFYHSFYYLCIKSKKFIKYMMGLPFICSVLKNLNNKWYDDDKDYNYIGYDIKKYLNPLIFNFNYIECNSFDTILIQLVSSLSIGISDQEMENKEQDYFIKSLNYNFEFYLEIKKVDLFENQLDFIDSIIQNNNRDGASIITNHNLPINEQGERLFYFSNIVYQNIFKFYNRGYVDSNLFEKFISFNSFSSIIHYLKFSNITRSIIGKCFNIEHLFEHFNLINSILIKDQDNQPSTSIIISQYWNRILFNFRKQLSKHLLFKFKFHILFGKENENGIILTNENIKLLSDISDTSICIFDQILKSNENLYLLEISKLKINNALKSNKINFLKYLYENGFLNNNNNSDGVVDETENLFEYLKIQFKNHYDYKFINWLK